jgi:ribosomal protein S21
MRTIKRFLKKCKKERIVEQHRERQYFVKPSKKRRMEEVTEAHPVVTIALIKVRQSAGGQSGRQQRRIRSVAVRRARKT